MGCYYSVTFRSQGKSLSHHGIPGQQWHVRRFQNEDGSLTPEGMRRYGVDSDSIRERSFQEYSKNRKRDQRIIEELNKEAKSGKQKSPKRVKIEQDLIKKGYTKEQAEIQAYRKEKAQKIIKVAAAVAVTAALAYGVYKGHKYLQKIGDKRIAKGTEIQRLVTNSTINGDQAAYVTYNKTDAMKYKGLYGAQKKNEQAFRKAMAPLNPDLALKPGEGVYQMTAKVSDKLKIAGERTGKKAFERLMKNDPDFAEDYAKAREMVDYAFIGRENVLKKMNDYDKFNVVLVDHDNDFSRRIQKKFYDALKAKGYDGVTDLNDRHFSGYNTKTPTILFNLVNKIGNKSISELSNDVLQENYSSAVSLLQKEAIRKQSVAAIESKFKTASKRALLLAPGAAAIGFNESESANRSASFYRTVINDYKKEHPNTKLSDDEILKNKLGVKS